MSARGDSFGDARRIELEFFEPQSLFGSTGMQQSAELEQMANILANCAEILRKLAKAESAAAQREIGVVADDLDGAAGRLTGLLEVSPRQ